MNPRDSKTILAELKSCENEAYVTAMDAPRDPHSTWGAYEFENFSWTEKDHSAHDAYIEKRDAFWDYQDALSQRIFALRLEMKIALEHEERRKVKNKKNKARAKKRKQAAKCGPLPVGMVYK